MLGDWRTASNVLCVRLDEMGDLLMTTPALRAIAGDGRRRVTVLTSTAGERVARCIPEVDEVIVHHAPWVKSAPPGRPEQEWATVDALERARFDAAVIFTVFSQNPLPSAYLCYLAGIPRRAAYCRENPYQLLTDWQKEVDEPPHAVRHEVRRQLDLVRNLGFTTDDESLSLVVPPGAAASGARLIESLGLPASVDWALVHPGASAPSRRYPPEHVAAVADRLADEGVITVFVGHADEVPLVETIRSMMARPALSLTGRLSLEELFAVIAGAPLLIANNTGPAHVAAALGTPVVVTYAQTNLQHTPWSLASKVLWHDVPCKFCLKSVCPEGHHDCLRLVAPEQVVGAALQLLGASRPARAFLEGRPA